MAILYVLWGVGLLSMIAVSFLSSGNVSYGLTRNALVAAQSGAIAEAALTRAVLALLDPRPERRWRVDGTAQEFAFGDVKLRISIQDELGRVDLNHADQSLLTGLFQSAGLGTQAASSVVDKILDWRDANPMRRLNGAKDREYRAAGYLQGPRNGPFQSVDELQLVMGIDPELYQRVAPALTVHSGRQFLDPQFAPREALLALPTMTADAVANLMAARTRRAGRAGIIDPFIPLGGRAFSVRTEIAYAQRTQVRETVVRLTDQQLQPYWVLSRKVR